MIPIPSLGASQGVSLGSASLGSLALTMLVALAPALVTWWTDRRLLARRDDPALPELIASRRRSNVAVMAISMALLLVFAGPRVAWGIPLLLAALGAASYPFRTQLLGETWSFGRYLWYAGLSLAGGFGFWIVLIYAPILVQQSIDLVGPSRLTWAAGFAVLLAVGLFMWEDLYPNIWLRAHAARPLVDDVLTPRFDEIVRRAGTPAPRVFRVGAQGSRFVNAIALPSDKHSSVAMGNALLELLDADETVAIFAHEVAHFDHFTPKYIRRARLVNWALIVAGVSLPLIAAWQSRGWASWLGWVWPFVVLAALIQRAARSQQHETESDLRAAALCGDPEALVRGLIKLHVNARIPRRFAVDAERASTHPSLVRRIQAIRASTGATAPVEQLEAVTAVQSTRAGAWVVIDDQRAYWLNGVPPGIDPDLASLRDAASSYRAVNYADMVELRVDASGDTRTIRVRTRAGESWSVPIALDDVARVQRALDVVDLRLGKVGPGPTAGTPKFFAIVAAAIAVIAGQFGILFVPITLALWKAGPSVMAALGAMSIMRALLGTVDFSLIDPTVGRLALVALAAMGVWALVVARRMVRASDAPDHFRLTIRVLGGLAALVAVFVVWQFTQGVVPIVGAPAVGTLATALVGVAAALFTHRTSWSRPAAFGGLVAAAALAVISVDRTAWQLRHALTETTAKATPDAETEVGTVAHQLRVSSGGTHFLVTRYATSRQASTVVLVGRIGGEIRELPAIAGEFVDSSRVLLLDALEKGVELRLVSIDSAGSTIWTDTIADIELVEPSLVVDRDSNSWAVAGMSMDDDRRMLFAGAIGQKGSTQKVVLPDSIVMVGEPIVFGQGATVFVPTYTQNLGPRALSLSPLSMLGIDAVQSELFKVVDGRAEKVATLRGYPQCGEPLGGVVTCASRHLRATSLYTIDAAGTAVEVAQFPMPDLGIMTVGPGARAASMKFDRTFVDIDLASRRLTTIALPPDTEFVTEARTVRGFVVTLNQTEDRKMTVKRYRLGLP